MDVSQYVAIKRLLENKRIHVNGENVDEDSRDSQYFLTFLDNCDEYYVNKRDNISINNSQ